MPAHFATAFALALGAALSLGLARFAYALLLPAMRSELGWSYATAGAMNTVNAAGYLLGALAMPWLLRRWRRARLFIGGGLGAALLLALHGVPAGEAWLLRLPAAAGRLQRQHLRGRRPARRAAGQPTAGQAGAGAGAVLRRHRAGHRGRGAAVAAAAAADRALAAGLGLLALLALLAPVAAMARGSARLDDGRRCRPRRRRPAAGAGAISASAWPATCVSAWATSAT